MGLDWCIIKKYPLNTDDQEAMFKNPPNVKLNFDGVGKRILLCLEKFCFLTQIKIESEHP